MANIPKITTDALIELLNQDPNSGGDGSEPIDIPEATPDQSGLMSKEDKLKLNGIAENAVSINHTHNAVTDTLSGFMTPQYKTKLDNLDPYSRAEVDTLINQNSSSLIWQAAIATSSLLTFTYPSPEVGWTVTAQDTGSVYRFDGANWIQIDIGTVPLATPTLSGRMSGPDKAKMDTIAVNANNYTHPATHPAAMISEDANHRFVTDSDKSRWNSGGVSFVVSPEAYGALPNGSFDCTTAFASAITALELNGGGTLQLSAGVYIVSTIRLVAQVSIRGTGWGSVIKLKSGSNTHVIQPKDDTLSSFLLENFAIDGNSAGNTAGSGIYLKKNTATRASYLYHTTNNQDMNATIRDVLVYSCADHGIFADTPVSSTFNVRGLHLDNVWLEHNAKSGLYGKDLFDFTLTNCITMGNGSAGYSLLNGASGRIANCKAYTNLQNPSTTELGEFHMANCRTISMVSCEAQEGMKNGFYLNAATVIHMVGCIADGNGQAVTSYYGYYLANACTYIDIDGTATSSRTPSWQWRALYVENGSNNTVNLVVKNQIDTTLYALSPVSMDIRISFNGAQTYPVAIGTVAPSANALFVGQEWVDTTARKVYKATRMGTGGGDWTDMTSNAVNLANGGLANIKAYGAKGDGSDATAALQACLDANNFAYVPTGSYRIGTVFLQRGATIRGEGFSTTFYPAASIPAGGKMFSLSGDYCTLEDFYVFGEAKNFNCISDTDLARTTWFERHLINNVYFYNVGGKCINFTGRGLDYMFDRIWVDSCGDIAIYLRNISDSNMYNCSFSQGSKAHVDIDNTNFRFVNCKFMMTGTFTGAPAVSVSNCLGVSFAACEWQQNNYDGLQMTNVRGATLTGCVFDSNNALGLVGNYGQMKLTNCQFVRVDAVMMDGRFNSGQAPYNTNGTNGFIVDNTCAFNRFDITYYPVELVFSGKRDRVEPFISPVNDISSAFLLNNRDYFDYPSTSGAVGSNLTLGVGGAQSQSANFTLTATSVNGGNQINLTQGTAKTIGPSGEFFTNRTALAMGGFSGINVPAGKSYVYVMYESKVLETAAGGLTAYMDISESSTVVGHTTPITTGNTRVINVNKNSKWMPMAVYKPLSYSGEAGFQVNLVVKMGCDVSTAVAAGDILASFRNIRIGFF